MGQWKNTAQRSNEMSTVREATYEVFRSLGMTTIFGNPGSNELPFLDRLPTDFRYILALHEDAGLAMVDGYSQATGRPVLVNLHAANKASLSRREDQTL
jgi:benzoylformate decarboxylase